MAKVFVSWSGDRSKAVALALKDWLPQVIQQVDPWVSDSGITKGKLWLAEVTQKLEDSSDGIICITPENVKAPWLNFEAGALAKKTKEASVRTALLGLTPTDVTGPLSNFQHTSLTDQKDVYQLVQSINAKCEPTLADDLLRKSFNRLWPELEKALDAIPAEPDAPATPKRSELDLLEEILERVRALQRTQRPSSRSRALEAHLSDEDKSALEAYFRDEQHSEAAWRTQLALYRDAVGPLAVGVGRPIKRTANRANGVLFDEMNDSGWDDEAHPTFVDDLPK